ncbi:MAG: flagellar hook-associated protein FlgK [Nevskiaceae bacterium]|nr:MAG: flagellar hook-associated protein FlgK [Nevskiaceae bacterium]
MTDMISSGVSALLAYQTALNTVSNNIANANTPGYSRQRTDMIADLNGGVQVSQVTRLTSDQLFSRSLGDQSNASRLDVFQQTAAQVDSLMSGASSGLAAPLQKFFSALSGVAADPQSAAARQTVLDSAGSLASQFNDLQGRLNSMNGDINAQLSQSVDQINQAAKSIAQLNNRIALAQNGGQAPNQLLDQRDQLVSQLSQQIGVTTVKQTDGSLNVFVAGGPALVLGATAQALNMVPNEYGSGGQDLAVGNPPVNVSGQISGGTIGGLLALRNQLIGPTENKLGAIAAAVTQAVNAQHAQGVDQNGQAGGAFFAPIGGVAAPSGNNSGSAVVSVGLSDVSQIGTSNYVLRYDGSQWSLSDASSGATVAMTGSGTAADPFVAAGMSLTVGAGAAAGDRYLVQPLTTAAGQMKVAISDPAAVAAAGASALGSRNSGDNSNANLLAAIGDKALLNGGKTSIHAANIALVSQTGNIAQQAAASSTAAKAIQQQSASALDSVSGVNLDEEAADLLRYQQAYQAAAQVVSMARDMFQSLLNATRGG